MCPLVLLLGIRVMPVIELAMSLKVHEIGLPGIILGSQASLIRQSPDLQEMYGRSRPSVRRASHDLQRTYVLLSLYSECLIPVPPEVI